MRFQIVGYTIGILLLVLGVALLVPAVLDINDDHANAQVFLGSAALAYFFGGALYLSFRDFEPKIDTKLAYVLTATSWLVMSLFCAVPYYFSDLDISYTDALFESVSGITTTGATVLTGLDDVSRGILMWRAITQWIGGIGVVAFAIFFLPFLRIGGMQLFQTESSDRSEKVMPRTSLVISGLLKIYCGLTLLCAATYYMLGMNAFDAIAHSMTTIPTGGFSTHDASYAFFDSAALDYACILFMALAGLPFMLYIKMVYRNKFEFAQNSQVRGFLGLFAVVTAILSLWLWQNSGYAFGEALRYSAFSIMSILTTTGYRTTDYSLWGPFVVVLFFLLTYLGACAGSTAGGIKTMRLVVSFAALQRQLKSLIYPNGVFAVKYQKKQLPVSVMQAVTGFLCLYVTTNVVLTLALALTGLDFITAVSGAATAIANVGPGLGDIIGPYGNYSSISAAAKWLLCAGMVLGRLEIVTVLVLFTPNFWKR